MESLADLLAEAVIRALTTEEALAIDFTAEAIDAMTQALRDELALSGVEDSVCPRPQTHSPHQK